MKTPQKLRLITYMSPGIPLELYQIYQRYLEEILCCSTYMLVESRWSGPGPHTINPFTEDDADIGFVCGTSYLKMVQLEHNTHVDLLPVAPVFHHKKNHGEPVMFSDIIVLTDKSESLRTFEDLRSHSWAYNDTVSLSGNYSVLAELRKRGEDKSFFSKVVQSGSHHSSIRLVKEGSIDCAAIDSNTLRQWFVDHPEDVSRLHTVTSLGPLPIQPIVYNTRMTADFKTIIVKALLNMSACERWRSELARFSVEGFTEIDSSLYDKEREIVDLMAHENDKVVCNGTH